MKFRELRKQVLSQEIVKEMLSMIESGEIGSGDKLSPERELAATLNVSRPSLREALRALAIMNVIEIAHGDGISVTHWNRSSSPSISNSSSHSRTPPFSRCPRLAELWKQGAPIWSQSGLRTTTSQPSSQCWSKPSIAWMTRTGSSKATSDSTTESHNSLTTLCSAAFWGQHPSAQPRQPQHNHRHTRSP